VQNKSLASLWRLKACRSSQREVTVEQSRAKPQPTEQTARAHTQETTGVHAAHRPRPPPLALRCRARLFLLFAPFSSLLCSCSLPPSPAVTAVMAERLARIYGTEEDKVSTTGQAHDRCGRALGRSVCLCAAAGRACCLSFQLAALLFSRPARL